MVSQNPSPLVACVIRLEYASQRVVHTVLCSARRPDAHQHFARCGLGGRAPVVVPVPIFSKTAMSIVTIAVIVVGLSLGRSALEICWAQGMGRVWRTGELGMGAISSWP